MYSCRYADIKHHGKERGFGRRRSYNLQVVCARSAYISPLGITNFIACLKATKRIYSRATGVGLDVW